MIYTQDIVKQAVFCKVFDHCWLSDKNYLKEGASQEAVEYAQNNMSIVANCTVKDSLTGNHYQIWRHPAREADADDWCFKVVEVVKTERVVVEWKEKE